MLRMCWRPTRRSPRFGEGPDGGLGGGGAESDFGDGQAAGDECVAHGVGPGNVVYHDDGDDF